MSETYLKERIFKSPQASVDHSWDLASALGHGDTPVAAEAKGEGVEVVDTTLKGNLLTVGLLGGPGRVVARITIASDHTGVKDRFIDKEVFVEMEEVQVEPPAGLEPVPETPTAE
jgi:hypothetical protein